MRVSGLGYNTNIMPGAAFRLFRFNVKGLSFRFGFKGFGCSV